MLTKSGLSASNVLKANQWIRNLIQPEFSSCMLRKLCYIEQTFTVEYNSLNLFSFSKIVYLQTLDMLQYRKVKQNIL